VCSITAGITEEIRFRGFLLWFLQSLPLGLNSWTALAIASVCFGIAHWYQGISGVLSTGLAGALLGYIVIQTQSLYVAMVIHALIDLRLIAMVWALGTGQKRAA
jgi:uncharacterized protein